MVLKCSFFELCTEEKEKENELLKIFSFFKMKPLIAEIRVIIIKSYSRIHDAVNE